METMLVQQVIVFVIAVAAFAYVTYHEGNDE